MFTIKLDDGGIQVNGRVSEPGRFCVADSCDNEGVTIRVDHGADLAFWLELRIPKDTLVRMLRDVVEAEHES